MVADLLPFIGLRLGGMAALGFYRGQMEFIKINIEVKVCYTCFLEFSRGD